ncbi:TetR/AcrR family transcriptional regulator [Antrihabitans stalactiti]|uniref:TetR/AcrR family transcriptional regulator n=1 Tax=Antrihabitans stalactiti TaxID=2584121 RepID=A0A848KM53_9NOCA|nr:TetR/AcrR family transcriptional regulator [Antrihabitans stalactiti]NMN99008.1 TetR/AcrR family transcriptional regulator [Antrihabitans stalactiti]
MPASANSYHHGDLPGALVRAAVELLENADVSELSLRAAARRAGVSPAAPYRHFADRESLLSAVAAVGYRELADTLSAAHPEPATVDDLADIAVAYVRFALTRTGLFRAMFAEPCDPGNPQRTAAAQAIRQYVSSSVERVFGGADREALSAGVWAFVHGLAFLHLDGKFDATSAEAVDDRVRAAVHALLGVRSAVAVQRPESFALSSPDTAQISG